MAAGSQCPPVRVLSADFDVGFVQIERIGGAGRRRLPPSAGTSVLKLKRESKPRPWEQHGPEAQPVQIVGVVASGAVVQAGVAFEAPPKLSAELEPPRCGALSGFVAGKNGRNEPEESKPQNRRSAPDGLGWSLPVQ